MPKPTALFTEVVGEKPTIGQGCCVSGVVGHPNQALKGRLVWTTPVQEVFADGSFETRNTIYKSKE